LPIVVVVIADHRQLLLLLLLLLSIDVVVDRCCRHHQSLEQGTNNGVVERDSPLMLPIDVVNQSMLTINCCCQLLLVGFQQSEIP
jgi:hypothetical protein